MSMRRLAVAGLTAALLALPASGAWAQESAEGEPQVGIAMGRTDPNAQAHLQQSMAPPPEPGEARSGGRVAPATRWRRWWRWRWQWRW